MRDAISSLLIGALLWAHFNRPAGPSPTSDPPSAVADAPAVGEAVANDDDDITAKVVHADDVKVVVFTAKWCGPCVPTKAAAKEACDVTGAKYIESDVDQFPAYAKGWGVDVLPVVLLTVDGKEKWRHVGKLTPATKIASAINACRRIGEWTTGDLREAIANHKAFRSPLERARVSGMTVTEHLTRDHRWPLGLVNQLTEDERHWLHDASHEGTILP